MPTEAKSPVRRGHPINYSITINAQFGSIHQRDVAIRTLNSFLEPWKASLESHHLKNTIVITHDEVG
jgi:hypothetical protein